MFVRYHDGIHVLGGNAQRFEFFQSGTVGIAHVQQKQGVFRLYQCAVSLTAGKQRNNFYHNDYYTIFTVKCVDFTQINAMKGGFCGFSLLHGKHRKQNFSASALQFCQIDKKHQTVAQIAYTADVVQKFFCCKGKKQEISLFELQRKGCMLSNGKVHR
ncbi:unknown [Corallococcus sp. CAG:1435]|nr:unknown [Corallococcus sp. CAG:1435]